MIKQYIVDALKEHIPDATESSVATPPKPEMGDFCINCAPLAKTQRRNPKLIAEEIAADLANKDVFGIEKVTAVGTYVNFKVDFLDAAKAVLPSIIVERDKRFHSGTFKPPQTVVVEYSSPNIAKPLGIHHLRSTMIGNALANLHEFDGHRVIRLNYLGDWGTQFGKLICAFNSQKRAAEDLSVDDLVKMYVDYSAKCKTNPQLEDAARKAFADLEQGEPLAKALWTRFKHTSEAEFAKAYQRLGVAFTEHDYESVHSEEAKTFVEKALAAGVAEHSQGAVIVSRGEKRAPVILQKSDGATTYASRDCAAAIARYEKYAFDKMLYVVGNGQADHFDGVLHTLKEMGHSWADRCEHVGFGLLRFEDSKLSTREGKMVLLSEVLDAAAQQVSGILKEKGNQLDPDAVNVIATGAITFADLSSKPNRDCNFIWKDILNFEGDTGPYLQYTATRCLSILVKSNTKVKRYKTASWKQLTSEPERQIIVALSLFPEAVERSIAEHNPSLVARYLLKLAKRVNSYLHKHRILNPDDENLQVARSGLIYASNVVMCRGLRLLGIRNLLRM